MLESAVSTVEDAASKSVLLLPMRAAGEPAAIAVAHGRGARLTLSDGREVIDGGSMSSSIAGHCHPVIVAAVEQAARIVNVNGPVGYTPREDAARTLLDLAFAGEPWADTVAFFVTSSEANDLALLLAQTLTGREPLVCRELSYHGNVGLARAVTTHPLWHSGLTTVGEPGIAYPPPSRVPIRRLPVPGCGVGRFDPAHRCVDTCLATARDALSGAAAVIMDYTQGGVTPSAQYQDELASSAREAGALWIADEVVTAFGRMGHGFAFQRGLTRPDMVVLGKGITGGAAPGAALVLSREVVEQMDGRRWATSSTHRGHPVAVAAIGATMRVVAEEGLVERAARLGEGFRNDLQTLVDRHPSADCLVGEGMVWSLRLAVPPEQAEAVWRGDGAITPLPGVVQRATLEHGAFIGASSAQTVYIVPPLVITEDELAGVVEALDAGLSAADKLVSERPVGAASRS